MSDIIQKIKVQEQLIKDYEHILALQSWDQDTGMPSDAVEGRARQMGIIQDLLSRELQSPQWEDWLEFLDKQNDDSLKRWRRLLARRYKEYKALPSDFMTRFVKASALARESWLKSREANDYSVFLPALDTLVSLQKERIEYVGYEGEPYNALLDLYEPGMNAELLEEMFMSLAEALAPMVERAVMEQRSIPLLNGRSIPLHKQKAISHRILKDMGYDFRAGRLDLSVHPFTATLGDRDIRLTSAFPETDFFSGLSSTVHEGGHGLYEQNLPEDWYGTMVAEACSLGFHESQSRLWENVIGRSRPFCDYLSRVLAEELNEEALKPEDIFHEMNLVEPSLIRVDADEYTYNLHIILRFRLERALINGEIPLRELSDYWNDEFKGLLGLPNENDRTGILQDIHWSCGDLGYFPTYTLGNLFASQIWESLTRDIPHGYDLVREGRFAEILEWLVKNIHRKGALYTSSELISSVSGEESRSRFFINYLKNKQEELYA